MTCWSTRWTSSTWTRSTACWRGETWAGLFSPQNRDYSMRVLPLPLDREPPPDESSTGGGAAAAGGRHRGPDELVQLARGPVRRHGELQPPVQLRQRRLRLRRLRRPRRRAGQRGGREPPGGPHPDLEHQVRHGPVVRPVGAAGRFRPPAGGERPTAGDRHQPAGHQAGGRDRGLRQARLPGGDDRPPGDDPGRDSPQRPRPLRLPQGGAEGATSTPRWADPDFRIDRSALCSARCSTTASRRWPTSGPSPTTRCTTST